MTKSFRTEIVNPPFDELTMLVYGAQGSGKTTFFGRSGCALIISTEPGARMLPGAVREVYHFSKLEGRKGLDFVSMVDGIVAAHSEKKLRESGIKIVVIDTIDRLYQMAAKDVCERNGVAEIGDLPFGKGYALSLSAVKNQIQRLQPIIPIAFISHSMTVTEEIESESGIKKEVEKIKPSVDRRVGEWLAGEQNLVGYAYKSVEGKFLLKFKSDVRLETKDRSGHLEAYGKPIPTDWNKCVEIYEAQAKAKGVTIKSKWAGA